MEDCVQRQALLLVAEDAGGERLAIERAVGGEDAREPCLDLPQPFRTLGDDVARNQVGVDDRHPFFREEACDRALAGADVAGETEDPHRTHTVANPEWTVA